MSLIFGRPIFKILSHTKPIQSHGLSSRSIALFGKGNNVKELSPYIITRANKEEFDEILKLMHDSFYKDEPTIAAINLKPSPILDEMVLRSMTEGFTLVAKCKYNGSIVGACINESVHPWDPDIGEKLACKINDEKLKHILLFFAYLKRTPDLFKCLGIQKVFEMAFLFVRKAHRKKGLAFRLMRDSRVLGADAGFSVVRCDATNVHTARICERLHMQKVAEVPYCSYLDSKLKQPIFNPPYPNDGVRIYCDCAPQFNLLQEKLKRNSFQLFGAKSSTKKHS